MTILSFKIFSTEENMRIETKQGHLLGDINTTSKEAKIGWLGIKPRFQRDGYGKELVSEFIENCKSSGVEIISIDAYF